MARGHGRKTAVSLGGVELTGHTNNSQLQYTKTTHDTTVYGKDFSVFSGGLKGGTASISGFYDSTAVSGPRAAILPMWLDDDPVELIHMPEGEGTGKPQTVVQVQVTNYQESFPVAEMITWTVELQFTDAVDLDAQSA